MHLANADRSCVQSALKSHDHASADELGAEVCPLCLARYAASVECICVACEAPSCPDCAEALPGTADVLCYACPVPTRH